MFAPQRVFSSASLAPAAHVASSAKTADASAGNDAAAVTVLLVLVLVELDEYLDKGAV
jgi:hypothetical protein